MYWKDASKGKFSIRSALSIMRHESDVVDDDCWDAVWKAPIQQRIRAFLWVACHDRLLGNFNRYKRRMTSNPSCFICGHNEETTLHILRDCPHARMCWRKLGDSSNYPQLFQGTLKDWITRNISGEHEVMNEKWHTLFGVTVWWIWRWRNCHVFDRMQGIPSDIGAFLQIRYNEARRGWEDVSNMPEGSHQKIQSFIRWQSPAAEWYVLNSDGAAKGSPGPAGGGVIIRDHRGQFISAFSANFGHCHALKAEVMAITKGIALARDLRIPKLEIQLDSLACVQFLSGNANVAGEYVHDIKCCRAMLLEEDWEVKVIHVYREGNRAADWLANKGAAQSSNFILLDFIPTDLARILEEDIRGVALPRLVPP